MRLRDRVTSGVARASTTAREAAAARGEAFEGLRRLFAGQDDQGIGIERFLLALVRAVRDDETPEDRTSRDVYKTAKRRRQRLALASFAAGPLVGVANQLVDLYCDAATVCDLEGVHRLELTDEALAAHLLVLWSVTDDLDAALAAVEGQRVASLLSDLLRRRAGAQMPDRLDKRGTIKALSQARELAGDVRRGATTGSVKTVLLPGKGTKDVIERAQLQLGVASSAAPTTRG